MMTMRLWMLVLLAWLPVVRAGEPTPSRRVGAARTAPMPFILWDGHRFARTAADHERDVRYFRDLGFTHSLVGARMDARGLSMSS